MQSNTPIQLDVSSGITLTILNDATKKNTVYVSQPATLDVVLTNNTGSDIGLPIGGTPATLAIYLPEFYTSSDLQSMKVSLTNWKFSADSYALKLEYTGSSAGTWKQGDKISFKITNAKSSHSAEPGQVDINLQNLTGNNVPVQAQASLTLANAPKTGNGDMTKAVSLSPPSQEVYVSTSSDPLENTLTLNIKNTRSDGKPLYSGSKMWSGSPQIKVSFLYGNLPGDLATSADKSNPQVGSAWNIKGKVQFGEGNKWNVTNPDTGGQQNSPVWVLKPDATNKHIIGTGANGNITFAFTDVVSLLPTGHTNMMVQFIDFPQDDKTKYNDHTFILDISKKSEPSRGILKFFSPDSTLKLADFGDKLTAHFQWTVFRVAKVELSCEGEDSIKGLPHTVKYPSDKPLKSDSFAVDLKDFYASDDLNFVLKAYDGDGSLIDSKTFPIKIEFPPVQIKTFTVSKNGDAEQNPDIEIDIFPVALLDTSTPISLFIKGLGLHPFPNPTLDNGHWKFSGKLRGVSGGKLLKLNTEYAFTIQIAQKFADPIKKVHDFSTYLVDSRDGKKYKVVELLGKIWMGENLAYDAGKGSSYFNDDKKKYGKFGMYYEGNVAQNVAPAGWVLPQVVEDWEKLIKHFGGMYDAYKPLVKGGKSGLDIIIGGAYYNASWQFKGFEGDYWAAGWSFFSFMGGSMIVLGNIAPSDSSSFRFNVRYIRKKAPDSQTNDLEQVTASKPDLAIKKKHPEQ